MMQALKRSESRGTRLLQQLLQHGKRLFTIEDAALAAEAIPSHQLTKVLSRLAQQGKLLRLRRGLYLVMGLFDKKPHPFVIATALTQPSAISHWSALHHHGLTEQIPLVVTASTPNKVLTPSMRKAKTQQTPSTRLHVWEIDGVRYQYITIQSTHFFGIETLWLDEIFSVSITDKERTLLDMFIYPKMFGGIGEALGILETALDHIHIQKLIDYALHYGKKAVIKRIGWALEYFGVPAKRLNPLLKVPMDYYCRLDTSVPPNGPYDKRWKIQNNLIKVKP